MLSLTAMAIFVDDHTGLERAVSVGGGLSPDVHPHASILTIRRGGEVGIVSAGAILGVENDEVVASAALAVVVDLEVAGLFGEAKIVQKVVVDVRRVEKLGDRSIRVSGGRRQRLIPVVFELERRAGGAVVVEVVRPAIRVCLSDTIVC